MTSFECSFRVHSKKECGVSAHYKHQTALLPVSDHLNGCYTTTSAGVEVEWQLCLYRASLFDEARDSFTICPLYRDGFSLGWRPSIHCMTASRNPYEVWDRSRLTLLNLSFCKNNCLDRIKYSVLFTTMLGVCMKCLGIHTKTFTALKLQVV